MEAQAQAVFLVLMVQMEALELLELPVLMAQVEPPDQTARLEHPARQGQAD